MYVLLVLLLPQPMAPAETELEITRKVWLEGELESLVTFGLLKEMICDSSGNVFAPSNRKYSSAINSIVRFAPDAKSYTQFSIDSLPKLKNGHITDFVLEPSGEIYALARQVLKYSDLEVPIMFGDTIIVHFDESGRVVSQLEVALDLDSFEPTGLAVLEGGEYLVVGFRRAGTRIFVLAQSFRPDGSLKAKLELGREGTKVSNGKRVASPRVYHPVAIKANGTIFVMRGTTSEPVYVLSESGQLTKTLQLKRPGLEFDSPHIYKDNLLVHQHPTVPDENPALAFRMGPRRVNLPVFDLNTGQLIRQYYWHEETLGLACYSPESMTFIGQDPRSFAHWGIFLAKPKSSSRPPATR